MFQMGGVGPMFGQCRHFRRGAPKKIPCAIERYGNASPSPTWRPILGRLPRLPRPFPAKRHQSVINFI